jgi:hypothetical protein
MIDLNDDNFLLYAAKCYTSPHYLVSEFESDLKRLKYIKRLIRRYKGSNVLKERLLLNHIILLYNTFGIDGATRMLFFKTDILDYDVLKTFLLYLNYLPHIVYSINGMDIFTDGIPVDLNVANILRKL